MGMIYNHNDENDDNDDCLVVEVDRKELLLWDTVDVSDWRVEEEVEEDLIMTSVVVMIMVIMVMAIVVVIMVMIISW